MIALAHVDAPRSTWNALDHIRNVNVRIGVAVTVRVGRQVVGHQEAAHLDELCDRLDRGLPLRPAQSTAVP